MSDFNSLVQYTVENISRPIKYIIYKLTEFIRVVDKFVFRQVPAGAASGYATIEQIEGNTVAWNQLFPKSLVRTTTTQNDITFTNNGDGSLTITGTATADTNMSITTWPYLSTLISGHKYFLVFPETGSLNIWFSVGGTKYYRSGIHSYNGSETGKYVVFHANNGSSVNLKVYQQYIDLTLLGIDNLTVSQVKAWMAQNIGSASYYDYNAGELISCKMSGIQTEDSSQQTLDTIALDVTTITGINPNTNTREVMFSSGMKQADRAGTVKDTLDLRSDTAMVNVGSRAYQSGDESDTTVITDGTTTYYALTTPIEYTDLQDTNGNPLNPRYKVEQGGTEQVLPVNTSTPTTVAPTLTTTYTKDVH